MEGNRALSGRGSVGALCVVRDILRCRQPRPFGTRLSGGLCACFEIFCALGNRALSGRGSVGALCVVRDILCSRQPRPFGTRLSGDFVLVSRYSALSATAPFRDAAQWGLCAWFEIFCAVGNRALSGRGSVGALCLFRDILCSRQPRPFGTRLSGGFVRGSRYSALSATALRVGLWACFEILLALRQRGTRFVLHQTRQAFFDTIGWPTLQP